MKDNRGFDRIAVWFGPVEDGNPGCGVQEAGIE